MIPSVLPTYNRAPLEFVKGEGSWLFEADGRRFLDLGSGIAVNALGHAHPRLIEALEGQARRLWHTSNLFNIPGQEDLARKLTDVSFADTMFFTNSGLEAMECCIKMARKFHTHNGNDKRWRIVTFEGSFHGRSLATIAAAGQEKLVAGFGEMPGGFDHVPFGDHDALKAAISEHGPESRETYEIWTSIGHLLEVQPEAGQPTGGLGDDAGAVVAEDGDGVEGAHPVILASAAARPSTSSSIGAVSRRVAVLCWLGW